MELKVSVIVPVYNARVEYFNECMDCLIQQSLKEMEIIVVNDGSNQQMTLCYEGYCKKDNRIKYLYQENRGVSSARNMGIEVAKGEYLVFVDADDWVESNTCELVYDYEKKQYLDVVLYGYFSIYINKELLRVLPDSGKLSFEKEKLQLAILQGDQDYQMIELGATLGKVVKRELLIHNNIRYILGLKQGEDALFSMYIYEYAKKIGYLPKALYHYRRSASSSSAAYQSDIEQRVEKTLGEYEKFIQKYHNNDIYKQALLKKRMTLLFAEILPMNFFHKNNPKKWKQIKRELKEYISRNNYINNIRIKDVKGSVVKLQMTLLQKEWLELLKIYYYMMQKIKSVLITSYK